MENPDSPPRRPALQYIYLIQPREFALRNEQTYKIGKTIQNPNNRLSSYPPESEIRLVADVKNCHLMERRIINKFKQLFTHKTRYGLEYFSGDIDMMKTVIYNELVSYQLELQTEKYDRINANTVQTPHITIDEIGESISSIPISDPTIVPVQTSAPVQKPVQNTNVMRKVQVIKKTPDTFCLHIYNTKPEWYKENELVLMSLILEEYQNYSGEMDITDSSLSRRLNGKLFRESIRTIGVGTFKRLFSYDEVCKAISWNRNLK